MEIFGWIVLVVILVAGLLAIWRYGVVRARGSSVIMRRLPANGVHGWRHGSLRYTGEVLEYFKLRSLAPKANLVLHRQALEFHGNRELTESEAVFMDSSLSVATLCEHGEHFEIAMDTRSLMALTAWVESAPDIRQERINFRELRHRATRRSDGK